MPNRYTLDEIERLRLPGYRDGYSFPESALHDDNHWDPVLSATILSRNHDTGRLDILTAIRKPETNVTHPNVVSTPTMRFPKPLARALLEYGTRITKERHGLFRIPPLEPGKPLTVPQLAQRFDARPMPLPDNKETLPFAVASLLATKLGAEEALERHSEENPVGTVSLAGVVMGFSAADVRVEGGRLVDVFEPLAMISAVVDIKDRGIFPDESSSYRTISWVDFEDFIAGHESRRPELMVTGMAPEDALVCVKGLCLATSRTMISDPTNLVPHLGPSSPSAVAV